LSYIISIMNLEMQFYKPWCHPQNLNLASESLNNPDYIYPKYIIAVISQEWVSIYLPFKFKNKIVVFETW
jgi:hypothetical protein